MSLGSDVEAFVNGNLSLGFCTSSCCFSECCAGQRSLLCQNWAFGLIYWSATGLLFRFHTPHIGSTALCKAKQGSINAPPNARHHPRPHSTIMREALKGRRVYAVVRQRLRQRIYLMAQIQL